VHEAQLLKKSFAAQDSEPLRLIDLAAPIRRKGGEIAGVIAAHIAWSGVRNLLDSFSKDSGMELILAARDGTVLLGPAELEGQRLTTRSAFSVQQGLASTNLETWPGGADYLVSVAPTIQGGDLPSFGWSLIARERQTLAAPRAAVMGGVVPILLAAFAAVAGAALTVSRLIGRPLTRIAIAAANVVEGKFDQPVPDERRFREVADLSASLSRLQSLVQAAQQTAVGSFAGDRSGLRLVRSAA
jgi:HAMP domain-containing protein